MKDMVQVRRSVRQKYEGPDAKIGRSQFNRSHGVKMSFNASYLYPIFLDEILPGDTFTCSLNGFARIFSPLLAPVMDNIELETFFFFCPTRLLWTNWAAFNGEHDAAGAQDTNYTIPVLATGWTVDHTGTDGHALAAWLGLPEGLASATVPGISCLPMRMYERVYNEWFRDQNVTDVAAMNVDNGPDGVGGYVLQRTGKKHDYFTSALPYLQKGTAVSVALLGHGRVEIDSASGSAPVIYSNTDSAYRNFDSSGTDLLMDTTTAGSGDPNSQELYVDLADVAAISVNQLRESVAIQRLLERDARGGTRYVEMIKAHFGVTNPDFRLQRPEYLGGGKAMINISPVANTSSTATEDQGELAGIGTGVISGHSWAKSFTEHGYVMGLIRARADVTYFQGVERMWSRSTRYDFYIPALANLGEQSILNKELWVSNSAAIDDAVFGYQERWAEYRMKHSKVVGIFNPDVSGSLSFWHLAEDHGTLPALNWAFLQDNTPMDRITIVDTQDDFLLDLWFNLKCARPLPVFSVPSLVNRF